MKLIFKKLTVCFCITVIVYFTITAEELNGIACGRFLFVKESSAAAAYIDGALVGTTPLLIYPVPDGKSILELKGDEVYAKIELLFDNAIHDIVQYFPSPESVFSLLAVSVEPRAAAVTVDGREWQPRDDAMVRIAPGKHVIAVSGEGLLPHSDEIVAVPYEEVVYSYSAVRVYRVGISPELPGGSLIRFTNTGDGTEFDFTPGEEILLYDGEWICAVTNDLFNPVTATVTVSGAAADLSFSLLYYHPEILFDGLKAESRVFLDDVEVTGQISANRLAVLPGEHTVSVLLEGFLPINRHVYAAGDEVENLVLVYKTDPKTAARRNGTVAVILLGSGVSLLAGGIILNIDDIAIAVTPDYAGYALLKYVTLGVAGIGLAAAVTGGIFGITVFQNPN